METLLTFNRSAALIGDAQGKVRPERRPVEQTPEDWHEWLKRVYQEPEHRDKAEEFIRVRQPRETRPTDDPRTSTPRGRAESIPFATHSNTSVGLTVRAAFDPHAQLRVVADREPRSRRW